MAMFNSRTVRLPEGKSLDLGFPKWLLSVKLAPRWAGVWVLGDAWFQRFRPFLFDACTKNDETNLGSEGNLVNPRDIMHWEICCYWHHTFSLTRSAHVSLPGHQLSNVETCLNVFSTKTRWNMCKSQSSKVTRSCRSNISVQNLFFRCFDTLMLKNDKLVLYASFTCWERAWYPLAIKHG